MTTLPANRPRVGAPLGRDVLLAAVLVAAGYWSVLSAPSTVAAALACSPLMPRFTCSACATELDRPEPPCPSCGGMDRHVDADVDSAIGIESSVRLQARHGEGGKIKPHMIQKTGVRWRDDRQRHEHCEEVYDRENDHYRQSWFDLKTGERVFHKEGRLSDRDMHGDSARRSKDPEPPFEDEPEDEQSP